MNKTLLLILLGTAVIPIGCTMAPKYSRPAAPVPAEWPGGAAYADSLKTANAPSAPNLDWREFFPDPKLQQLIETALAHNRDLKLAALNVERARAMYGIQRANLWPALDASASGSKQRMPADLSNSGKRQTTERYDANLGVLSWEIDFFGRIRSFKDRALQEYLASEQARRSAQILLVSSVANACLAMAADRENLKLSETTLQAQQAAYDLIKRRYELGLVDELDLLRARTPLDIARRDLALYTERVAKDENALNLLIGSTAAGDILPAQLSELVPPAEIGAGVSSDVLLQRPDVLQAENLLKAANADIGAARAAFFPRISLTAAIGTASSDLSGLFTSGSGTWSYAPQIVMPIFDARVWSAHKAAKVQREIAVTQYEKAIQNAFKEVADGLATQGTVDQQVAAQQSLVDSFANTYRLSKSLYDKGINSYFEVLDAQRSLFAAQQALVFLRLEKLTSQVRLYSVLGGGWNSSQDARPTAMTTTGPQ
ncbi:MAG TPA: efflux transporter outer membrane subunit [Candidatus Paceibacterota bacterium]|nr:efflux transporter outer membrane subunit [Verrucomicrobiota bacterium]HRY50266.1 efflux transporter outer membrane subunit [Candidatus Paceibacterota bacterium]